MKTGKTNLLFFFTKFLSIRKNSKATLLAVSILLTPFLANAQLSFCPNDVGQNCDDCPNFTVTPNPAMMADCQDGITIALVLDESGSIGAQGGEAAVEAGVLAFLNELVCTQAEVAIVEFSSEARYVVTDYTLAGNIIQGVEDYFNGNASNTAPFNGQTYNSGGGTNWQAGLQLVDNLPPPDIVFFFTDGIPTAYLDDPTDPGNNGEFCGFNNGNSTQEAEIYNAVQLSNNIKGEGSHMFVLGVGDAATNPDFQNNTFTIAGNTQFDSNGTTPSNSVRTSDYAFESNFAQLAMCLADIANNLCPLIVECESTIACSDGSFSGQITVDIADDAGAPILVTLDNDPGTTIDLSVDDPFTIGDLNIGTYTITVSSGTDMDCFREETCIVTLELPEACLQTYTQPCDDNDSCTENDMVVLDACTGAVCEVCVGTAIAVPEEPETACYEAAIYNTTTCMWDVTGEQDPEPTDLECYETATFNDVTCMWEVTGEQPAEPPITCYETATFNEVNCVWDVMGEQLAEPPTACYETTTFNETTCIWDVTGDQPVEPATECYETATFNDITCVWEISGDQDPEPTGLECWQTAFFNILSCEWEVTGDQDPEPTDLACYEMATFNDGTCVWDVSGLPPLPPLGINCWDIFQLNQETCSYDNIGMQDPEPTDLACYETAIFNDASCMWDITSEQDPEPTGLECYETATFNGDPAVCAWEVSGQEPLVPTDLECNETTIFDDDPAVCAWIINTDPIVEGCTNVGACNYNPDANCDDNSCLPVQECNSDPCEGDITIFSNSTCSCETINQRVIGCMNQAACDYNENANCDEGVVCDFGNSVCANACVQVDGCTDNTACNYDPAACFDDGTCEFPPAEPTGLECYETAVVSLETCSWDIINNQDPEPTDIACYETATFNDQTCIWDIEGEIPDQPVLECWEFIVIFDNAQCMWIVDGVQAPEPSTACYETAIFNNDPAVCDWEVSGEQPDAPIDLACYEQPVFNDDPNVCNWIVTGTQPAEPASECYETAEFIDDPDAGICAWITEGEIEAPPSTECYQDAVFDDASCTWFVVGTQPAEPSVQCYETATFNNETCSWEITGDIPAAPTIECYETTTFSNTSCMWTIIGEQPEEPNTTCYETAIFNNDPVVCNWEVTGDIPSAPATACYEIATFNDDPLICEWEINGEQPAEPTIACYETATFNDLECDWDISGEQPDPPTDLACDQFLGGFNDETCSWEIIIGDLPNPDDGCEFTEDYYVDCVLFHDPLCPPGTTLNEVDCICETDVIPGCTDPCATNYNPDANQNDDSCTYPPQPYIACFETVTFSSITCTWVVAGEIPEEPETACYETAIFNDNSCEWNVTGEQPPQPYLECYQEATFNHYSCQWDITGEMPEEPATACYETATFSQYTCTWVVSGEQPLQPSIACYEEATFSDNVCKWVITGEMPDEPATTCYETATFSPYTCTWLVNGSQPTLPPIACYETVDFNESTCEWDISGNIPEEPATSCYETATFSPYSCTWITTGEQPQQPITPCFQTATFNNNTCAWDLTGEIPEEPATACYETATFSVYSCTWVITELVPTCNDYDACTTDTYDYDICKCQFTPSCDNDTSPPIIEPNWPGSNGVYDGMQMNMTCGDIIYFDESYIEVTDNCDYDIDVTFTDNWVATGDCNTDNYQSKWYCEWTATDNCGNVSTFGINVTIDCAQCDDGDACTIDTYDGCDCVHEAIPDCGAYQQDYCTYPSAFYGDVNNTYAGLNSGDIVNGCLNSGAISLGLYGRSITVFTNNCIASLLPSFGGVSLLPEGNATYSGSCSNTPPLANALAAHLLTLKLNMINNPDLAYLGINDQIGCLLAPQSVLLQCGGNYTVGQLSTIADYALGGYYGANQNLLNDIYIAICLVNDGMAFCKDPCVYVQEIGNPKSILPEVDNTAESSDSESETVDLNYDMEVIPTIATDKIQVALTLPRDMQDGRLRIVQLNGQTLVSKDFKAIQGRNIVEVDINTLPVGIYYVSVTTEYHKVFVEKIIKK